MRKRVENEAKASCYRRGLKALSSREYPPTPGIPLTNFLSTRGQFLLFRAEVTRMLGELLRELFVDGRTNSSALTVPTFFSINFWKR
jgi:hypothetical protein